MEKYEFKIAMTVRAYGTIIVEAKSAKQAMKKLRETQDRSTFKLHGDGSDDLDVLNATDVYVESYIDPDTAEPVSVDLSIDNCTT